MMKEYKNQIAKLKLFFYEKINDKKIANNFINLYRSGKVVFSEFEKHLVYEDF